LVSTVFSVIILRLLLALGVFAINARQLTKNQLTHIAANPLKFIAIQSFEPLVVRSVFLRSFVRRMALCLRRS